MFDEQEVLKILIKSSVLLVYRVLYVPAKECLSASKFIVLVILLLIVLEAFE